MIVWNILLTALVGWGLAKNTSQGSSSIADDGYDAAEEEVAVPVVPRDPAALKEAHIAFFYMDSVQKKYELIAEKGQTFPHGRTALGKQFAE